MKKIFQTIGLLTLICFSFFLTDKTVSVIKEQDELMITLLSKKDKYSIQPINAIINNNTIIPGINGKELDINKSYTNLKKNGYYHENLLIFKDIIPNVSIKNNKNKYIIKANDSKKEIAILFTIDNKNKLDQILPVIKNIKVSLFIDVDYLINNISEIRAISNIHEIYNYGYRGNYTESLLTFGNNLIERNVKNKSQYCLIKKEQEELLKVCQSSNNYTILPNIITKNNPYTEVKNNISNGSIILLEVNTITIKELPSIISLIKGKGYQIVGLSTILNESVK